MGYHKKQKKGFTWLEYSDDHQEVFSKICKKHGISVERTGGTWVTKPFNNWKKALEKKWAHSQSQGHIQSSYVTEVHVATALKRASITQLIQNVTDQHKMKKQWT